MCSDFEQQIACVGYCALMQAIELGIPTDQTELDLPPVADVRITDMASVLVDEGDGPRLQRMAFGFPPSGKGGPIFNVRSEGRSFASSKRAVIPMSAFYEFTGTKSPKAKHRFTLAGLPILGVAGLSREAEGNKPRTFTLLTCEPGQDVAPCHNRQIVALRPKDWRPWLELAKAELLSSSNAKTLAVETVRQIKG